MKFLFAQSLLIEFVDWNYLEFGSVSMTLERTLCCELWWFEKLYLLFYTRVRV
jgi:hypothetical protein